METKKWWQSKTIWGGIIGVILSVYQALVVAMAANFNINLPMISSEMLIAFISLLGFLGIVFRKTTTTVVE